MKDALGHGSDPRGAVATHAAGVASLSAMTQDIWNRLTPAQRDQQRDNSSLTPQLSGLEGHRVEATTHYGETRRFIVGKSTGWRPIHLEIKTARSSGGGGAERSYKSVRSLGKVR
jgi:hypothetical protein